MQERLIESAVLVFAEKGLDASVIDDVIEIAGVSRGTFYNYFHSNRELLIATSDQLGNELIHIIERNVMDIPDPAELLATGSMNTCPSISQKGWSKVGLWKCQWLLPSI